MDSQKFFDATYSNITEFNKYVHLDRIEGRVGAVVVCIVGTGPIDPTLIKIFST